MLKYLTRTNREIDREREKTDVTENHNNNNITKKR